MKIFGDDSIDAMAIGPGTIINYGPIQYKVLNEIDSGGFGVVYLAKKLKPFPGGNIVIKVPAAHVQAHPIWIKKFAREARILGNIKHRNVVKIIAFWEFPDGQKALAQELVRDAVSLSPALKQDQTQAPSYFLQALYAIRAFHGRGGSAAAIHRDLSPNNMLIGDDGILKVIDFGLAKEDPRLTQQLTQAQFCRRRRMRQRGLRPWKPTFAMTTWESKRCSTTSIRWSVTSKIDLTSTTSIQCSVTTSKMNLTCIHSAKP